MHMSDLLLVNNFIWSAAFSKKALFTVFVSHILANWCFSVIPCFRYFGAFRYFDVFP